MKEDFLELGRDEAWIALIFLEIVELNGNQLKNHQTFSIMLSLLLASYTVFFRFYALFEIFGIRAESGFMHIFSDELIFLPFSAFLLFTILDFLKNLQFFSILVFFLSNFAEFRQFLVNFLLF